MNSEIMIEIILNGTIVLGTLFLGYIQQFKDSKTVVKFKENGRKKEKIIITKWGKYSKLTLYFLIVLGLYKCYSDIQTSNKANENISNLKYQIQQNETEVTLAIANTKKEIISKLKNQGISVDQSFHLIYGRNIILNNQFINNKNGTNLSIGGDKIH